jgi:dTDP-4-amino-4,6-dideoxygalactose transaminase
MKRIRINAVPALPNEVTPLLLSAFKRVVTSKRFLEGKENLRLAQKLRPYLGGGYIIPVASGHDAIVLALKATVKPNDEVIVPALAYPTAFAAWQSGATIVPVDVGTNGQLSPETLEKVITRKTKAVIAVHLFGQIGDIRGIASLLKKRNIPLIEDCCQAFGGRFEGRPIGTFGDIACFSFYPTKTLGALGNGGVIRTNSPKIRTFLTRAKSYGEDIHYRSLFPSFHSGLPELQAAGLLVYMQYLEKWMQKRKSLFSLYKQGLPSSLHILTGSRGAHVVPLELAVEGPQRTRLAAYLARRGIETAIHYPQPFPLVPAFSYLGYKRGDFPIAERLAKRILSLPLHPFLTAKDVRFIINAVKKFYETSKF